MPDWLAKDLERAYAEGRVEEKSVNVAALAGGRGNTQSLGVVAPPPAGCSEDVFQDHTRRLFLAGGWLFYHTRKSKGSDTGFPDCVAGRGVGQLVVAELKVKGRKPTEKQEAWLAFFRTIPGARVFVWEPKDWPQMIEVLT